MSENITIPKARTTKIARSMKTWLSDNLMLIQIKINGNATKGKRQIYRWWTSMADKWLCWQNKMIRDFSSTEIKHLKQQNLTTTQVLEAVDRSILVEMLPEPQRQIQLINNKINTYRIPRIRSFKAQERELHSMDLEFRITARILHVKTTLFTVLQKKQITCIEDKKSIGQANLLMYLEQ